MEGECGVCRYARRQQESSPEQHEQVTKGHTPRSGRGQGTEDRATKVRGHRGREGPGAMQEGSKMT